MKNLYIDFDGVIADTIPPIYKYLNEQGIVFKDKAGFNQSEEEFNRITALIANFNFHELLTDDIVINNAFDYIKSIHESDEFNVSILTHVNSLEEGIAKVNFIHRFLKGITIIMVPKKISKTLIVDANNAILVDDFVGNLEEWEKSNGTGILFNKDLDKKGYPVIDNLNRLSEVLNED